MAIVTPTGMAAVGRNPLSRVRPPAPGEGTAIAALWRELWDAHQEWGGYPGSSDAEVYARVAARLDDDARVRAGRPVLGSHAHFVADLDGVPCGQVEGWIERQGWGTSAPLTCEVRSLVVTGRARSAGFGRALLDALERTTRSLALGARCVLAAEVLEPNPAHAFYQRVGFVPVAWNAGLEAAAGARFDVRGASSGLGPAYAVRPAVAGDASVVARLEGILAARRREAGDLRFEPPQSIDATVLTAVAAHLAAVAREQGDSVTLVAVDRAGYVRGAASVVVQTLDPPFMPVRRALVGRFALDPVCAPAALVVPLVAAGCEFAQSRGAARVEVTNLTAPGTPLHEAALAAGAHPWSRVVVRQSPVPCPAPPHG